MATISTAQITLMDYQDILVQGTEPTTPKSNMLWLDTSLEPNKLKRFNGSMWDNVNDMDSVIEAAQVSASASMDKALEAVRETERLEEEVEVAKDTSELALVKVDEAFVKAVEAMEKAQQIDQLNTHVNDIAKTINTVFTSTPTVPYKKGDLWVQGSNGDILTSTTTRTSGSYVVGDWVKANKYTDDSKAIAVATQIEGVAGRVTSVETKASDIEKSINGFKTTVSETYTTKTELTDSVGTITEKIGTEVEQLNESIELKASTTSVEDLNGVVTDLKSDYAKFKVDTNAITSTVSEVVSDAKEDAIATALANAKTEVSKIKVGGRNLLLNADMKTVWLPWAGKGETSLTTTGSKLTTTALTQSALITPLAISPTKDLEYTLSFKVRGNFSSIRIYLLSSSGTGNFNPFFGINPPVALSTTEFREITVTFPLTTDTDVFASLFIGGTPKVVGEWIEVAKNSAKLELGNLKTDFTIAQEDIDTSIGTVVNDLETTKGNVTKAQSTADTAKSLADTVATDLSSTNARVSTAENKLTATSLTTTISTALAGSNSISTTKFVMDKTGLTINNGGLKIQNNEGTNVLTSDTNGNLTITGTMTGVDVTARTLTAEAEIKIIPRGISPQITFMDYPEGVNGAPLRNMAYIHSNGSGQLYLSPVNREVFVEGALSVDGKITAENSNLITTGQTGWVNTTYNGGWIMTDVSWIRSHGNKNVYVNKILRADGGLQVGDNGSLTNVDNTGVVATNTVRAIRFEGRANLDQFRIGNTGDCRFDTTGGNIRLYTTPGGTPDCGIYVQDSGQVVFKAGGVNRHIFNVSGTKTGGTMEVEGTTYGMSPIDSPQTLIEYVEYDVEVVEEKVIYLDPIYRKMVSKYSVFCSNRNMDIEKHEDYFILRGTGITDIDIKGQRKEEQEYFKLVGGFENGVAEEINY